MADLTIAQRVHAGAAWLDEQSSCNCVLGQMYGDYCDSPDAARWWEGVYLAPARGFSSLSEAVGRDAKRADYAALTEAWRTLIEERRTGIPA